MLHLQEKKNENLDYNFDTEREFWKKKQKLKSQNNKLLDYTFKKNFILKKKIGKNKFYFANFLRTEKYF